MDFFTVAFNLIATKTALFIINGLVGATIQCWKDVNGKRPTMTPEALETLAIINQVSEAILTRQTVVEAPEALTEDIWQAPLNPVETAIATIKANSQKPEILLLTAPKPLTVTQINKMKKVELEAECLRWNVQTGIVKVMKDRLKEVAVW